MDKAKFKLGTILMTSAIGQWVRDVGERGEAFIMKSLQRYRACDWKEMDPFDKEMNNEAIKTGEDRIFASYKLPENLAKMSPDDKIFIITEWDRSYTTIMFASDY